MLTVLAIVVHASSADAQARPDTLRLDAVVEAARTANPMLQAARLRADAAEERIVQAGAPPDPQFSFGLVNRPLDGFGTGDEMTMNEFRLSQTIPWPGKLGYGRERERRLAGAARLDAAEAELMLIARVKAAYFELAYMDRALLIMAATRDLLRDLAGVTSTMYAVGDGLQQDVLQAQVAVARMTEDITVMQQNRVAMGARLNALLGREATIPIGALELPVPTTELPAIDSLMAEAVANRPALAATRERVQAAEAGYRAARRELYPDLMLTAAYGQRPQFGDMATLMVGISIPVWAGSRQLPLRREMRAMRSMADAEALETRNETFARLAEIRSEAQRSRNLARLYAGSILPQSRAAVTTALAAYRAGKVNFLTLIENQMTANRYQIDGLRLTAAYHSAVAEIEALTGGAVLAGPGAAASAR